MPGPMGDPELEQGWIDLELGEEFPGLGLVLTRTETTGFRSPGVVRDRLRQLAGRITGGHVIHMRQDHVPWAYRVFWRQVGLDPDTERTPVEGIALERLRSGGLRSRNLLDDAITIATLETGVPLLALDADRVGSAIGLRLSAEDELLGGSGRPLSARQIVVADESRALAILSGEVSEDHGVTPGTRRVVLAALEVDGVPRISVEEALWTVAEMLETNR